MPELLSSSFPINCLAEKTATLFCCSYCCLCGLFTDNANCGNQITIYLA